MYWICSLVLRAAGPLDFIAPALPLSPLAKSTLGDANAMPRTSLTSACMTMCEPSPPSDCEPMASGQLTLWPHPSRAKTPAELITTGTESTASARVYTERASDSSTNSDQLGHFLRTSIGSLAEDLTRSSTTWKRSTTHAGRSVWALTTSAQTTLENEFGWSVLTPTKTGNLASPSMAKWRGWWGRVLGPNPGPALRLAFSEWLMGYPPGWLVGQSKPTATPSCHKSQKPSAGPS